MAKHARGLICLALSPEICDALELPPMTSRNTSRFGTAFCESIEASEGVTTGISGGRSRPHHPGRDRPELEAERSGEAGPRFPTAGPRRRRAGACRSDRGGRRSGAHGRTAARRRHLRNHERGRHHGARARVARVFCKRHGLKMISVADLIRYRLHNERCIERHAEGCLRTEFGSFRTITYASTILPEQHIALVHGILNPGEPVLVRMHSHCVYGDVFGSTECDCHDMIRRSMQRIAEEGSGVLVYLHQTGPGHSRPPRLLSAGWYAEDAARGRYRRADPGRSWVAIDPPADQPSAQGCGSGGLRDRDCGPGTCLRRPVSATAGQF